MKNLIFIILLISPFYMANCQENFLKTKFNYFGIQSSNSEEINNKSGFIEFYKSKVVFILDNQKESFLIQSFEYTTNSLLLSNSGRIYFKEKNNYMNLFYELKGITSNFQLEKNDFESYLEFYKTKQENISYYEEGKKKLQNNSYEDALKYLDKAILLNPYSSYAYFLRASAKAGLNRFTDAIIDLNNAINIDNRVAIYFTLRANLKSNLQNDYTAIEDATIAINIDPNNYLPYKIRGIANYNLKNYGNVISDLSFVINYYENNSTSTRDGNIYFYRGLSYYVFKEFEKSCEDIEIAKNLGIENAKELYDKDCN